MNEFLEGLLLQASLILALGAQNIFLLESAIKNRRPFIAASVCSVCDFVLILIGVVGVAGIFIQNPLLKISSGVLGTSFLVWYAILKIQDFLKPSRQDLKKQKLSNSLSAVIMTSLAFSLLNPHVYLDVFVLIGGFAAKYETLHQRLSFGFGAAGFSVIWFFGLVSLAGHLKRLLTSPEQMKYVSLVSGIVLFILSLGLGQQVLSWSEAYFAN